MFTVTPLKNGRTCSANRSHPYDAFQKFDDAIGRFCHAPPIFPTYLSRENVESDII